MADPFYYVDARNERIGPVSREVLEQLRRAGTVHDETLVSSDEGKRWIPFVEWAACVRQSHLPPVPGGRNPGKADSRSPKRRRNPSWPALAGSALAITATVLAVYFVVTLPEDPYLKISQYDPGKIPLAEIGKAINTMPETHHPVPDPSRKNKGFMLLFTGEDSVQIQDIPNSPGLYQIDLIRYGVVYDDLPSEPSTRNAVTLLLTLGTEFKDRRWNLLEAEGGSVDQVTRAGQSIPDEKTTESIPRELAMWHGQRIIDYLNNETKTGTAANRYAAGYRALEESFLQEHRKIE